MKSCWQLLNERKKMASYSLNKEADEDFERIFDYGIDLFGFSHAYSYVEGMKQRFSEIAENPLFWQSVDFIRPEYRRSVYGKHSIYYLIKGNNIIIARILGRENLKNLTS